MAEFPASGEFNNAYYCVINIYNSPKSVSSFPRLTWRNDPYPDDTYMILSTFPSTDNNSGGISSKNNNTHPFLPELMI